jgi:3-dehydroquinate synthetase
VLIGLGGGVCTDLVTMAAALVRRGIRYIRIPTTLMGQVDAGIGIKGAVNAMQKKSALGCFYSPKAVFLDPSFLTSLPLRHLSAGTAEIIKVALVSDQVLFQLLEKSGRQLLASGFASPREESRAVIWCSAVRMLEELSCNLYEDRGYIRLMDFGHTFSPLLESRSGFRLLHGEAVAIDMALTIALAKEMGFLTEKDRDRAVSAIATSGLPIISDLLTEDFCAESFRETAAHRGGTLNFVVPIELGRAEFVERAEQIPISRLRSALTWLRCFEPSNCSRMSGCPVPIDTPMRQTRMHLSASGSLRNSVAGE